MPLYCGRCLSLSMSDWMPTFHQAVLCMVWSASARHRVSGKTPKSLQTPSARTRSNTQNNCTVQPCVLLVAMATSRRLSVCRRGLDACILSCDARMPREALRPVPYATAWQQRQHSNGTGICDKTELGSTTPPGRHPSASRKCNMLAVSRNSRPDSSSTSFGCYGQQTCSSMRRWLWSPCSQYCHICSIIVSSASSTQVDRNRTLFWHRYAKKTFWKPVTLTA